MSTWLQYSPLPAWKSFLCLLQRQWFTSFGNVIEWYDLSLYGYFALTFAHLFFPAAHHSLAILFVFFTYAVGIIIRPLGGLLFGHLGDTKGHVKTLNLTVNSIALPTFCIGLLPSYHQVGLWAPAGLLLLRCLQGLCAGGQYVGAMTVLTEQSPSDSRALGCSIAHVTSFFGYILAVAICFLVVHSLTATAFMRWGWRLPFLLSLVFVCLNFLWRKYWQIAAQKEAAVFVASAHNKSSAQQPPRWPILSLWQNHRRELLLSTLLSALMGALYSSVFVYMFSFMQQFTSINASSALVISALLLGLSCLLVPWFADFADSYGRRPIIRLGFGTLLLVTLPAMYCIMHGGFLLVLFGVSLLVIAITLLIAAAAVTYCELFPETVRYSGAAVSYNVGMALLGSTSPLLIQAGIMWHGNVYIFAFYLLILAACGLFVSRMLPETTPKLNLSNLQKVTDYATST